MPYAPGTVKIILGGTIVGGEQFAHGYQVLVDPGMGQTDLTKLVGEATGALTGSFLVTATKALFSTLTVYQSVRAYLYTGGSSAAKVAENLTLNIAGTGVGGSLPPQIATVVSIESGVPGRSNRGRSYLPPLANAVLQANSQLASSACTQLANSFAAMLTSMNAVTDPDCTVVIGSSTKGATVPVNAVRVDSILDTQRRRRNKIVPAASISASV